MKVIFLKEYSIWGLPPEQNRYTPSLEDINYHADSNEHFPDHRFTTLEVTRK